MNNLKYWKNKVLSWFKNQMESMRTRLSKYPMIRYVLLFLPACLFAFMVEHRVAHIISSGKHPIIAQSIFDIEGSYQWLSTAGWRKPKSRYTELVEIDAAMDVLWRNSTKNCLCGKDGQRMSLAKILRKISVAHPKVIVVDKYFSPDTCPDEDPGTLSLKRIMNDISQTTPIVVGRVIDEEGRFLKPSLEFSEETNTDIREGIIHLDTDTRKAPLQWRVATIEGDGNLIHVPTISLLAAEAYDEELLTNDRRLERILDKNEHPYISFLKRSQFNTLLAGELLSGTVSENKLKRLKGKIVVIGESHLRMDNHLSVIGDIPGFVLQGNYIEALLDTRYMESKKWLDFVLGFFVFAALYFVILCVQSLLKSVFCVAVVLLLAFGITYIVVTLLGWYVNLVTMSAMGLLILLLHKVFPKVPSNSRG